MAKTYDVAQHGCPKCGAELERVICELCDGEGLDAHDCGEDCCCLDPEPNVPCDICRDVREEVRHA